MYLADLCHCPVLYIRPKPKPVPHPMPIVFSRLGESPEKLRAVS